MNLHIPRGGAKKAGLPPGTIVYVGKQKTEKTRFRITNYNGTHFEEKETKEIEEILSFKCWRERIHLKF